MMTTFSRASAAPGGSSGGIEIEATPAVLATTPQDAADAPAGVFFRAFAPSRGTRARRHDGSMRSTVGDSPSVMSSTSRTVRASWSTAPITVPNRDRSAHTAVTTTNCDPVSHV